MGEGLDTILKKYAPHCGFTLIVFKFDEPGLSNYISNAERKGMIKGLKETVKRLEANEDTPVTWPEDDTKVH